MENKKVNFAVKDAQKEKQEITVYYDLTMGANLIKSGTCSQCHRSKIPVAKDELEIQSVIWNNQSQAVGSDLYNKAKTKLERFLKDKHCERKSCSDRHVKKVLDAFDSLAD